MRLTGREIRPMRRAVRTMHRAAAPTSIGEPRCRRRPTHPPPSEQRDVDNTSIAVHVDEPGDGTPVGQENRATADAAASTSAAVENAGEASVQQDAQADASAAQSGVSNTSIVMRVGSPGDDPGVSQANLATSTASASAALGSGDAAYGAQGATATVTQEGITNTAVSVRVSSRPVTTGRWIRSTGIRVDEHRRGGRDGVRGGAAGWRAEHECLDPRREPWRVGHGHPAERGSGRCDRGLHERRGCRGDGRRAEHQLPSPSAGRILTVPGPPGCRCGSGTGPGNVTSPTASTGSPAQR